MPLEVLLAKANCVAHQGVTVAILVWQTQLRDKLRIGHQALHAPMLLASRIILLITEIVVDKLAHMLAH